jgi:hypothetical protein
VDKWSKIKVELQRTDGHWFSYGISLRDEWENCVPLVGTSITFEAPGMNNLDVEGEYRSANEIEREEVAEAAEKLIDAYQDPENDPDSCVREEIFYSQLGD